MKDVELTIGPEAVVLRFDRELDVISSAIVGGGVGRAQAIVNLHVDKHFDSPEAARLLARYALQHGVPAPYVGLFTAAWTERARAAETEAGGVTALVVATVGLSHPIGAGVSPVAAAARPSTINTIVVVDAAPTLAAMVNLVMTVTEVKTLVLAEAGMRCADGSIASGTSTDAVVVAATGRGRQCRFGGPVSDLGWVVASAARSALEAGVKHRLGDRR